MTNGHVGFVKKIPVAIDPMAIILPSDVYPTWEEIHHPNNPLIESIRKLTPAQRKKSLAQAIEMRNLVDNVIKALNEP